MQDKGTVCAIVVTYNRKELLIDCLDSLREQTRPSKHDHSMRFTSLIMLPQMAPKPS
jgi:glycosyltransferase involved in cell wall biosynthesis